jgi:hypothetical protein
VDNQEDRNEQSNSEVGEDDLTRQAAEEAGRCADQVCAVVGKGGGEHVGLQDTGGL